MVVSQYILDTACNFKHFYALQISFHHLVFSALAHLSVFNGIKLLHISNRVIIDKN